MPLTEEQVKEVKAQLLKQIETTVPKEQQKQAKSYILSLNPKDLEDFLTKNKLVQQPGTNQATPSQTKGKQQSCVFCGIANKQMPALALFEDKDFLAVLEIKPFSTGHTILIPKKHIKKTKSLPSKAFTTANRIGKHVAKRLKAESFQVTTAADMDHAIINIIPTYKKEPLTFERKETNPKELQELAIKIGEVTKRKVTKKPVSNLPQSKTTSNTIYKMSRRIP